MKVALDLAISADSFIARTDGDSDWVDPENEELFYARVRDAGCLVVGRKTFEMYKGELYPMEGALNIVLSSKKEESDDPNVVYATSPEEAIRLAEEKGCSGIVVGGGAATSSSFLKQGFIDEIFFTLHPLFLFDGMKPFGDVKDVSGAIELVESREVKNGVVQLHYRVKKEN